MDFVKDDFSNFPKLPDSREAKDELVRGDIADRIRSGGSLFERQTDDETSPSLTYGGRQERDKNVVPEQYPATSGGSKHTKRTN